MNVTKCATGDGLERRHRRWWIRRGGGGAGAGADDAAAVGAAGAGQRRQLHALHAVPARGRGGDAGAAARGDAAAGDPQADLPAAGRDRSATIPGRSTVELRSHDGEVEELPYDQLLLALGSVSRVLPVPGLSEHAVGFKSLADAIWLRNHVVETLEAANATDDAGAPRRAAHLRLRRRRLRRPRGARRAAGLRRRRDGELPARPPARHALGAGRGRPTGSCRRSTPSSPTTPCASCAAAASTSASAPRWRR